MDQFYDAYLSPLTSILLTKHKVIIVKLTEYAGDPPFFMSEFFIGMKKVHFKHGQTIETDLFFEYTCP